ncbi:hypothetical protein PZA11_006302 [Diplocarpon coronariae]
MATLASSSPPRSPSRMPRRCARKCERYCCLGVTYFPLFFVYSITSWAVWVETTIGFLQAKRTWAGNGTAFLGISLYLLLNWSYTTAVFTSPGTTVSKNGYSSLPTHAPPAATNFTVKSNGELRFCKKCQARKPDRAHHCSTCKTCVLKMDHHCPWLATCVGLRNYKAFLLFLIYTTLFCFVCFGASGYWVYREILTDGEFTEALMPMNYVMLAVISGIIGLVLAGFTGWHILLASRGQTTIECLETTRYLSPLRVQQHMSQSNYEQRESGRSEEGQRHESYDALERFRARERYEAYLDEQDSTKLPSAFDLGRRRNLAHLFGPSRLLWFLPICNTTGDGWTWEASPKWLEARERIARERREQQEREHAAGWGPEPPPQIPRVREGAGRHYVSYPTRTQSKADRLLGRAPDEYTDEAVPMQSLRSRDPLDQYDVSSDEDEAESNEADSKVLNRKAAHGWPQRVGVVTNTLLGNTIARQKNDVRGRGPLRLALYTPRTPSSAFQSGIYHGRIVLPPTYPLRPPSFRFLTPSGRFEVNREICLSISGHHEETWMPAWGVRTALTALRSFMETDAKGQLGGLDTSKEERGRIALSSGSWKCGACGKSNAEILRECEEAAKEAGSSPEPDVPVELAMAYKDQLGKNAEGKGEDTEGKGQGEGEDAETELAEGFVKTTDGAGDVPETHPVVACPPPAPVALRPSAPARPAQSVPQPTAAAVPNAPRAALAQAYPTRVVQRTVSEEAVPVWIDRAIGGVVLCLVAMLLKVLLGL